MRFISCGRISVAGLLVVFLFALSSNAQTESSSVPNSSSVPKSMGQESSKDSTPIGLRSGKDLFEHQWKPTEPVRVGRFFHEPIPTRKVVGLPDASSLDGETGATPVRQPTQAQLSERLRSSIGRRLTMSQSGPPANSLMAKLQNRIGDGLGPLHNATSCADCHPHGGASGVEHNVTLITVDPRSDAVRRDIKEHEKEEYGDQLLELFPSLLNGLGILSIETVVHDQSTSEGYAEIRSRLASYVPGGIDSAWFVPASRTSEAIAKQAVIAGRHAGVDFYLSQRNSPPLFGLGLIERIRPQRLAELAKKQARESGGEISGRVAMKFGWRGQIGSVAEFVSQACASELGLTQLTVTQPGDPVNLNYQPPGVDMSLQDVMQLTNHIASIPVPTEHTPSGQTRQQVSEGESTFNAIGCVSCHVPDVYPALNIFSDLLLHDMGDELQAPSPAPTGNLALVGVFQPQTYPTKGPISENAPSYHSGSMSQAIPRAENIKAPEQPQFPRGSRPGDVKDTADSVFSIASRGRRARGTTWDELQREWRTPPLWGIADTAPYLHDGRASTLEEAIRWHGGEAGSSRDKFESLSESEKTNLLAFLCSLQAPDDVRPPDESSIAERGDTGK